MKVLRVLRRYLDWHTVAVSAAATLVALLGVLVVTSILERQRALDIAAAAVRNEQAARTAAAARVAELLAQQKALRATADKNAKLLAQLQIEIALLQQQIRDMGGQPVIVESGQPNPTPRAEPSASPTSTRRSPAPRPTVTPSPSPSRTICLVLCSGDFGPTAKENR